MKVLVYDNKGKDSCGVCLKALLTLLDSHNIEYNILQDSDLKNSYTADALFSIGGDGTILWLSEFANKNQIPLIGINAGQLGFLTEFEKAEVDKAVEYFLQSNMIEDRRPTLKVTIKDKTYLALNDVFVQIMYNETDGSMTADVIATINDKLAGKFKGDGVVVSSSTGSTAYSFSVGGPIISPNSNVFVVTPIAAHGFNQRSIVFDANDKCEIKNVGIPKVSVYVDGKSVGELKRNDYLTVEKADNQTIFLRRPDYDYFKKLSEKIKSTLLGD